MKRLKNRIHTQILKNGKLHTSEKILLKGLKFIQYTTKKNCKEIIKNAIINVTPILEIRQIKKKKRKGLKEFSYVLNKQNRITYGIKQFQKYSKINFSKSFFKNVILLSKKKSDYLKNKELNQKEFAMKKKYAFFRWFY